MIKNLSASAGALGDAGSIPGPGRFPREGKGNSILARIIPWTEEPDGLQSMGSQRAEPLSMLHTCSSPWISPPEVCWSQSLTPTSLTQRWETACLENRAAKCCVQELCYPWSSLLHLRPSPSDEPLCSSKFRILYFHNIALTPAKFQLVFALLSSHGHLHQLVAWELLTRTHYRRPWKEMRTSKYVHRVL